MEAEKSGAELDINAFNAIIAAVARVGNLAAARRWLQRAREAGEETGGQRRELKRLTQINKYIMT